MLGRELTLPEIEESIRQPAARIKARLRTGDGEAESRSNPCEDSRATAAATTYNSRISRESSICSTQKRSPKSRWSRARMMPAVSMLRRRVPRLACIPQLVDRTSRRTLGRRRSKTKVAHYVPADRSIRSPVTGPRITETSAAIATAR